MNGHEKSDPAIVAVKLPNEAARSSEAPAEDEQAAKEAMEPRAGAEENARQQNTHRTQSRERVNSALERVRQLAVTHPRWEPYALIGHVRFCAGGAQQCASLPRSVF